MLVCVWGGGGGTYERGIHDQNVTWVTTSFLVG